MKIALACDHAGFALKDAVVEVLNELHHTIIDCGTNSCEKVDFPDFAFAATQKVSQGQADLGILICGSGVGMCIAANKVKGIRASVCHDTYSAHQAVEHDNLNVLCLGSRVIGPLLAKDIVRQFLSASFKKGTSHEERLNKIIAYENAHLK